MLIQIKNSYQEPQIKIVSVKEEDIIATSGNAWEIL